MKSTSKLEVLLTPADFAALAGRNLAETVCVVIDVLRATTSMITALANGAKALIPVATIAEALALRRQHPDLLLAGERDGVRIRAELTGGVEFDLGNSPREFTVQRVQRRTLVMSTTNGTRALRACTGARTVLVSSWLNLQATADWLRAREVPGLILVCSGTLEEAALEDTLAAGALADALWPQYAEGHLSDAARMARHLYLALRADLPGAMRQARNGQRLLAHPDLRDDVAFSLRRDSASLVAALEPDGAVREQRRPRTGRAPASS
jgi:2-phosphosulfolactate phosphatase